MAARFIIGVDLGTTNCCVYYIDTEEAHPTVHPLRIPQLTNAGYFEQLSTLPSFCYLASEQEWPQGALDLPWKKGRQYTIGPLAKEHGAKVPTRLVQSAKSWLCHSAAKRCDPILPVEAADEAIRISPVEATSRYLQHIREAWDHAMAKNDPENSFDQQEVVVTVPASFDEIARTLTVEAATKAGYRSLTLLEEPQAAFYSWISKHENSWQQQMQAGQKVLVCDVGGGTTDFSLIEVVETEKGLGFQRMAVGNHLLLGGDNIDAFIAHLIDKKMRQANMPELNPQQWVQLRHQGRNAKEQLLGEGSDTYSVLLQGTGSSVVKGSLSVEIEREEVLQAIQEGFFGSYSWEEASQHQRTRGIRTMGLPYEDEPSITKHLAQFICQNGVEAPDYVLFNGGSMKPETFRHAITDSLKEWFADKEPTVLETVSLDLAVARGAAYYGKVKRGLGTRIGGGSARGYYLAIGVKSEGGTEKKALTLLPRGTEEGTFFEPEQIFSLKPNTPVSFELLSSHTRLHDQQEDLITINSEELQPLPSIHTILRYGKKQVDSIPVRLHIGLTPIGTLELWLKSVNTDHTWNLQFQLRGDSQETRTDETFDESYLKKAETIIHDLFNGSGAIKPNEVIGELESAIDRPRSEWTPSILRGLWKPLIAMAQKRKCSSQHEARWWNLVGYCLRPGFGYPLDDFRIKELWKIILSDNQNTFHNDVAIQFWICCRRIAGGLNKGQQMQLANLILPTVWNKSSGKMIVKTKKDLYPYHEKIRALAALELLQTQTKVKLGKAILQRIQSSEAKDAEYWALGRIGARHLVYGSVANVLPVETCAAWIDALVEVKGGKHVIFTLEQLARKTEHPELNVPQDTVKSVLEKYHDTERLKQMLTQVQKLSMKEQAQVLGDNLPAGLSIEG